MTEIRQTEKNILARYKDVSPIESASKPYTMATLPDRVRQMPTHAQEIWLAAFNAAFEEYGESRAFAIAAAAVNEQYELVDGRWQKKE